MNGISSGQNQHRLAMNKVIETSFKTLWQIWDEMGIEEVQKKNRADTALEHVKNLLNDMVEEEKRLCRRYEQTIQEFTEKLDVLCDELSFPHVKLSPGMTMIQREKALRAEVELLTKTKAERVDKYNDLHSKDIALCEVLCATPFYVPSNSVPSTETLKDLEKHVTSLEMEKDKRFSEFVMLKKKILELYVSIETDPDTSFGRDLICEEDDTFTLSEENMETLKALHEDLLKQETAIKEEVSDLWDHLRALWDRLETPDIEREEFELHREGHGRKLIKYLQEEIGACERLKFQNMQKFVLHIRNELITWWDKCYYSPEQRDLFHPIREDNFTEQLLEIHEQELQKLKDYYKENRAIIEKINLREKLFKEMIVFDEKSSDPNRFFKDRGGKLLQEEKARKKLMKELPKVEEEVTEAVLRFEKESGREFLVNGMRFPQYIVKQWDDFHFNKEQQKQCRLKAKAKQTQDEIRFGSQTLLNTPSKRRGVTPGTPQRTPLKARKLNDIPKTPNTTGKLSNYSTTRASHSTMIHSPFSSTYARQPLYQPKTPSVSSSRKRRSIRLMKKAATERKSLSKKRRSRDASFSRTMVSGDHQGSTSLASTGTYSDFTGGLRSPNSRSSIVPSKLNLQRR